VIRPTATVGWAPVEFGIFTVIHRWAVDGALTGWVDHQEAIGWNPPPRTHGSISDRILFGKYRRRAMAVNVDIVKATKANTFFRQVLSTGQHSQVVVMSIPPEGEIGEEIHEDIDQVLAFVEGEGVAILDGEESPVGPDRLVHVPAGMRHNFVNRGSADLRLFTVYAPPRHARGTIHKTQAEAEADEADQFVPSA
jgi:mannose-6-phosphate isomerase-like protein (cupin superfamily)